MNRETKRLKYRNEYRNSFHEGSTRHCQRRPRDGKVEGRDGFRIDFEIFNLEVLAAIAFVAAVAAVVNPVADLAEVEAELYACS